MTNFRHPSLLWKILLSTSIALTALFALTGYIVQRESERATSASLEVEVRASFRAYESLWRSRAELLSSAGSIVSSMSDVRAAFSTGDQATIRDTAGELWSHVSSQAAIFIVTDPHGRPIASLGDVAFAAPPGQLPDDLPVVRQASAAFPRQSSGFLLDRGRLFQVAVTPVYVQSGSGPALIDVLVAGLPVDDTLAATLRQAAGGSEFVFFANGAVAASTLPHSAASHIFAAPFPARVSNDLVRRTVVAGAAYDALFTPLRSVTGQPIGSLAILRSFAAALDRARQLQRKIISVWIFAVLAGLAFTYLLARRIVEPIERLDRAAAQIAQGNYDCRVDVTGGDEIARLAATFDAMRRSILDAREELIRRERIATIGLLSTSIVHDLRNPLAAIYGGAEMLVDNDLPPDQVRRLAGNLYRASRRIQEMLEDLVNISRGKSESLEPCRLRDIVTAAWDSAAPTAATQGVGIQNDVPANIELPLDRARMERVFFNLIDNALDAMPNGGELRIGASQDNGSVLVAVQDTGTGISAEMRPHLFRPFITGGKRNGLGLGLTLSRQALLDHGGDLWLDDRPGPGARFCLRLAIHRD